MVNAVDLQVYTSEKSKSLGGIGICADTKSLLKVLWSQDQM